jgi:hypothetical protein
MSKAALAWCFPRVFMHHRRQIGSLLKRLDLEVPFNNSVYTSATLNVGPRTACWLHNDSTNYPGLPCAVTAFGAFDPDKSGHLIAWNVGVVVRFPQLSTVLLSSSSVMHGNTAISSSEQRFSFTQYVQGSLYRSMAYSLQPATLINDEEKEKLDSEAEEGWEMQLARIGTLGDLEENRRELLKEEEAFGLDIMF